MTGEPDCPECGGAGQIEARADFPYTMTCWCIAQGSTAPQQERQRLMDRLHQQPALRLRRGVFIEELAR